MPLTTRQAQNNARSAKENEAAVVTGKNAVAGKVAARPAFGDLANKGKAPVAGKKAAAPAVKDAEPVAKPRVAKSTTVQQHNVVKPDSPMEVSRLPLLPANVPDIDEHDHDNPQLVAEYVNDIYAYMRELETRYPVPHHYLESRDVTGRMRAILVDWLVQVHLRFHLLQETLYLTVAIIDRFLAVQEVSRPKLQLVGVTAMLIASKYEEMYAPEMADFVYITDNAYSKADIRTMECIILKSLDFQLGRPLPLHFLRRNSKAGDVDASKHALAKYLMELSLGDYELAHVAPSKVAAAALLLSIRLLDGSSWCDKLEHYSQYSEKSLLPVVQRLAFNITKASGGKLSAIYTKYASSKFVRTSHLPELKSQVVLDLAAASSPDDLC